MSIPYFFHSGLTYSHCLGQRRGDNDRKRFQAREVVPNQTFRSNSSDKRSCFGGRFCSMASFFFGSNQDLVIPHVVLCAKKKTTRSIANQNLFTN